MENQKVRPDQTAQQYYENFQSNPTNGFISHHDIFSLLMSKIEYKDKLDFINKYTNGNTPFTNLKGITKEYAIMTIVKPIIANTDDATRMQMKADLNAMKAAAAERFTNQKTEKGEIKFIESKVSTEEYVNILQTNRDSIRNGAKNENGISTAMLLLASLENKNTFNDILTRSGINTEKAQAFTTGDMTQHTPTTNELKKLIVREINASPENVLAFKEATNFIPNKKATEDLEQKNNQGIKM